MDGLLKNWILLEDMLTRRHAAGRLCGSIGELGHKANYSPPPFVRQNGRRVYVGRVFYSRF
jgi:hypothetical protein